MARSRNEIEAELNELRAEKNLRVEEKMAQGTIPRIVITGCDSPVELGPNEVLALRVVTGVPRGDEIVPHAEPERVEAVLPARYGYPVLEPAKSTESTASKSPPPPPSAVRRFR